MATIYFPQLLQRVMAMGNSNCLGVSKTCHSWLRGVPDASGVTTAPANPASRGAAP